METVNVLRYLVVVGSPTDGLSFYGPFIDEAEAIIWAERIDFDYWWTSELRGPL